MGEFWRSRLKFSSEIEVFKRDWKLQARLIFSIFVPLGNDYRPTKWFRNELDKYPGRNYIRPPLPPFWPEGIFEGEGGGVVCFVPPRGRNFIRPPSFICPPPLEGYFRGGGGCAKFGPPDYRYRTVIDFVCELRTGKSRKAPLRRKPLSTRKFPRLSRICTILHDFARLSTTLHDFLTPHFWSPHGWRGLPLITDHRYRHCNSRNLLSYLIMGLPVPTLMSVRIN